MVDPDIGEQVSRHASECAGCARFDALARRALLAARNAPQIEVSADFSSRLAARIAEERRSRIASQPPSHVEVEAPAMVVRSGSAAWRMARRAAVAAAVMAGVVVTRGWSGSAGQPGAAGIMTGGLQDSFMAAPAAPDNGMFLPSAAANDGGLTGEIVVVRGMRPVGGALLPMSDDPLLDGGDKAGHGDITATSVAATAPLWPTAHMAAHAANRFIAMEFGDVIPVITVQTQR